MSFHVKDLTLGKICRLWVKLIRTVPLDTAIEHPQQAEWAPVEPRREASAECDVPQQPRRGSHGRTCTCAHQCGASHHWPGEILHGRGGEDIPPHWETLFVVSSSNAENNREDSRACEGAAAQR